MTKSAVRLVERELAYFDGLAALTHAPDESLAALRRRYALDDRLRVPGTVFNALRRQCETL